MGLKFGVGVYTKGIYKTVNPDGSASKESYTWNHMLERCYSEKYKQAHKTYESCTVDERFHHFQYFAEWCNSQVGFVNKGWHLDKDILVKGNKIYSPDICVFVPQEVNVFYTKRDLDRGDYPIGVYWHNPTSKYRAQISLNGLRKHLGLFESPEGAYEAYKEAKEAYAKELAYKYKDIVDNRVYDALMFYEVSYTD